jgi:uncharacterized membrane protein
MLGSGLGRCTWIWQACRADSGEEDVSMGLTITPYCVETTNITSQATLRGCATDTQTAGHMWGTITHADAILVVQLLRAV